MREIKQTFVIIATRLESKRLSIKSIDRKEGFNKARKKLGWNWTINEIKEMK